MAGFTGRWSGVALGALIAGVVGAAISILSSSASLQPAIGGSTSVVPPVTASPSPAPELALPSPLPTAT